MTEKIATRDSKEYSLIILQILEVRVFDGIDYLILNCLIYCTRILIDSTSFIMLKLELVSQGNGEICCYRVVYSQVRQVGPSRCCEGDVERCLHYDANFPMASSSLWYWNSCFIGI